jgi:hypothetical protein
MLEETEVSSIQGAEGAEILDMLHRNEEHSLISLHDN